jgi:hypothetical protein
MTSGIYPLASAPALRHGRGNGRSQDEEHRRCDHQPALLPSVSCNVNATLFLACFRHCRKFGPIWTCRRLSRGRAVRHGATTVEKRPNLFPDASYMCLTLGAEFKKLDPGTAVGAFVGVGRLTSLLPHMRPFSQPWSTEGSRVVG